MSELIVEMALCEVHHIGLRPNQLYRFIVMSNCEACKKAAEPYTNEEIISINHKVQQIVNNDLSWDRKYDLVFSSKIYSKVKELARDFSWYDPDCDYKDDVLAFAVALNGYVGKL